MSYFVIFLLVGFGALFLFAGGSSQASNSTNTQESQMRTNPTVVDGIPLTQLPEDYTYEVNLPQEQWRQILDTRQYQVLREKGTERAFDNPLWDNKERGIYYSAATGAPLFHSDDKYDSGTGWPSFTKTNKS